MARPRKPTAVLVASGAFDKNPQRARERANEPQSTGKLGDPPDAFMVQPPECGYLEAERLRRIWVEIAEEGPWISKSSRGTVQTLCRISNDIRMRRGKIAQLAMVEDKLRSSLGLTEASRSKINAPTSQAESVSGGWQTLAEEGRRPRLN